MKALQKALFILFIAGIAVSCGKEKKFTVEGKISGADGKTMYLEHVGYAKVTLLDSIKLKESGTFKWKQPKPAIPDFYRLRLGGQVINFAIDSTEQITISGNASGFTQNYTVEGSEECKKIKELALLQIQTAETYNKLLKAYNANTISQDDYRTQSLEAISKYKSLAQKCIFENPTSTSAYFALFQQINNLLIFDPYDKGDYKVFGAVATSWNQYHPNVERTKHLYNLTLQALKVIRGQRPIEVNEKAATDYFDFSLPDIEGKILKLSEFTKGKILLLDFTAYQAQFSSEHNILLNSIYEKYKNNGLEILQVSLDSDEHFWKVVASNLPWTCVRDPHSVYSEVAGMYNVKDLPTCFIFNRNGEIVKRVDSDKQIENDLKAHIN